MTRVPVSVHRHPWVLVALAVVLVSTVFVLWAGIQPEFDTYGWLVWGRQALHLTLDTDSAPSWKPFTFLFTFPYALAGRGDVVLWMITAVATTLAGPIFAGRLAYRLAGPAPGRRYAPIIGAVVAGLGVLGLVGYGHLVLIAASDPMDVTLTLAAIDCHLSRRPRVAWVLLVLLSLARPEAWAVAGLYALWAWRTTPSMRAELVLGVVIVPALWFGMGALTSRSWSIASDVALGSTKSLPGTAISRLLPNFWGLYELPMKLAMACALAVAVVRRERVWLGLAAAALAWMLTWAALALHGWNPSPRYLFEAAAVLVVLAGATIGWALANAPRHTVLRWAVVVAFLAFLATMASPARNRERLAHNGIVFGRVWARQLGRLSDVIDKEGPNRILACGQAVSYLGFQTILAYDLGRNISTISYQPGRSISAHTPIVFFQPYGVGWKVRPIHSHRRACRGLSTTTAFR